MHSSTFGAAYHNRVSENSDLIIDKYLEDNTPVDVDKLVLLGDSITLHAYLLESSTNILKWSTGANTLPSIVSKRYTLALETPKSIVLNDEEYSVDLYEQLVSVVDDPTSIFSIIETHKINGNLCSAEDS